MRRAPALLLLGLVLGWGAARAQPAEEVTLHLPPPSLAAWYKPANRRQVWLHTMFGLRREMQAAGDYAALGELERLREWGGRFAASYRRIGEMVPQWSDALDLESLQRLESAMAAGDAGEVPRLLRKLSHSCDSCHREYRAVTVALYRTPDFSALRVDDGAGGTLTYPEAMERLSVLVNRVRIASDDGRAQAAREALHALDGGLDALAGSCGACHRDAVPADRVFADRSRQFAVLGAALETADREAAGRALGDIAVKVCALCHGVHRTLHDLKARLAR